MPQLLNGTGAAEWGDVDGHPWTTGMQLDYYSEAVLWAEWMKTETRADEGGPAHVQQRLRPELLGGLQAAIKGTDITVVKEELHEATAPEPDERVHDAGRHGAEVVLLQTTGAFCTQAMAEVEKGSLVGSAGHHVGHLRLAVAVLPAADRSGPHGQDTYLIQTFMDVNDPAYAGRPVRQALPRHG